MFLAVTLILDAFVYWFVLQGPDYFLSLTVWLSYALLLLIPWIVGRRSGKKAP